MSVLANHQLRPAASSRAPTRRRAPAPRVATVAHASSKESSDDDTSKTTHRENAVGALVAGVAAASVALTAVPNVALAKAKPVTETPGASSTTELNAAALYDKVSAANQAKVATPSDDAEPAVNQAGNASGPKKTTRTFDSFADFKAELAEDMVTAPSTKKEPKKPTQKSFDATQASTKKESFATKLAADAQKRAEDDAKYAALRAEYEAKMDRIRAERRLEEKARVAQQNAEVRAKKEAAKAKSDEVAAKNAAREAAFRAEQDAKLAAKTAAQAKEQKKNAAGDKKRAAASEKKAKEAAKKKAESSAAAKKAKLLKARKELVPGVNAPAPRAPEKVPLAPRLETTKPRDVPAKEPVAKTNPLLPEVQLAKKAPAEKSASKKAPSQPASSSKKASAKASQSKKMPAPKKKKKSSDSSPLTPLVYLGLFYLAYAFITDDE